ncbi:MAG: hypothetical protein GF388_07815 [Candidatus Aegiribacteria sp.]|nr:hypothetical protein [Candidatus Aegiribacteria sp.]MBD3295023.1 hypothetical protein [Candidatus Fermentibacteria bacterium]
MEGESLVARGPFVIWGDAEAVLIRGDFYGPDGKPAVSLNGDSSGITVYLPGEETAFFFPRGIRAGGGTLSTEDLVFLLRTGYPVMSPSWGITDNVSAAAGMLTWSFITDDSVHSMALRMKPDHLFPEECLWHDGGFAINGASAHDEYRSWPWNWSVQFNETEVSIELTELDTEAEPWESIWSMNVPVPVDTVAKAPLWRNDPPLSAR